MAITPIASMAVMNANVLNLLAADIKKAAAEYSKNGALRQLMGEIRDEVMIPRINHNFEIGGEPMWDPILLSSYNARRSVGKKGRLTEEEALQQNALFAHPLIDTGQMRTAATAKARFKIAHNEMTYGNWPRRRWFGPIHDLGGPVMPKRQFVQIKQPDDVQDISRLTLDWAERAIDKHVKRRYR